MRCLLSSVVACLVFSGSTVLSAQDPDSPTAKYDKTPETSGAKTTPRLRTQSRTRVVVSPESAARLIHERALTQARMRRARIEARQWAGVSLLRPTLADDRPVFASDWGVPAGSPWWWNTASTRVRLQW